MKHFLFFAALAFFTVRTNAQTNPAITSWLQNTTQTGSYYTSGSSVTTSNNTLVNCQEIAYSDNWVYVHATGIPAYPTGPFLDGNSNQATNQNKIIKLPLIPTQNTGTATATTMGDIGVFINGVPLFDYRDGAAWSTSNNALCGGPGNPPCTGGPNAVTYWTRDAIPAEMAGFDCSKGHPAHAGDYHHHQNPSAFKLDLNVVSTVCNLYDADGLYVINTEQHAPLLGYAFDGFPIYGAYGYTNTDGTGGITRIKSGYQLRNITVRTEYADGTDVPDGPAVSTTYPLGYFREDYEFVSHTEPDYLDVHNGRFCVTPEYPDGTYAYFTTVDENHNSAFPYAVGPTYYGNKTGGIVTSVTETTTTYTPLATAENTKVPAITVFPNPSASLIAIQIGDVLTNDYNVALYDTTGKLVQSAKINKGQTIAYFDVKAVAAGTYMVKITSGTFETTKKVVITQK